VYPAESVLVGRIESDGVDDLAWTLERPSTTLDTCAELLDGLGLSGADIRARERWPFAALLQMIAEQLARRCPPPLRSAH
jgi:hypothetical protein